MKKGKRLHKASKKVAVIAMAALICGSVFVQAAASTQSGLSPTIKYTSGDYTFEKVSHPNSPVETADGIVDYAGGGKVSEYVDGESEGNGDRGQSYSYASAVYGDWVYINTMYGGLGVSAILQNGMGGMSAESAKAMMDVMYNGHLYTGEPDGAYAGGVLLKFNVKTGETKILMSRDKNGIIPTFRNACKMNGKLYFVGMVVDTSVMTPEQIQYAIRLQTGLPCVYEIDPENNDKQTRIYNCVDMEGYSQLVKDNVFTSTRAIGVYNDALIAGCLDTDGVFLCASENPSAGEESFKVIANMDDLFNYPAYHRSDVNGGGGIYQVIEYNDKLYVVICTGSPQNKNEQTGTMQTFAIVRGECSGDPTDADAWTWSVLAGDENDGARYPFGLDKERVSAGACSLEIYNDKLYIGDYNDVSSALQSFVMRKSFKTQATNLEQSINLYRMDEDENIEMIVGDPTEAFPNGGISGLGSGYETHMSQYTWQTTVYEGKLYVSTMDTTTLLEPIAQFTNGDLLDMSSEEWESLINYIQVMIELLTGKNESTKEFLLPSSANESAIRSAAENAVDRAIESAKNRAADLSAAFRYDSDEDLYTDISLTAEQREELVSGLIDGSIEENLVSDDKAEQLAYINNALLSLTELVDSTDIEAFLALYKELLKELSINADEMPENLKALYDLILNIATEENLADLASSIKYLKTSEAGFDLYEIEETEDGGVNINSITTDGFGDRFNHGLRIFAKTEDYLLIGTANPFYGTQLWRRENTDIQRILGDVDNNGKVNLEDAILINKYAAKLAEFDKEALKSADFDNNGEVNLLDAILVQKFALGLVSSYN